MKMNEISSAEEQLALVRVIFDNTWKALEQQAEQQRRTQAKAKPKPKPKLRTAQRAKAIARPMPAFKPVPLPPAPISKPNATATPTQTSINQSSKTPYTAPSVARKTGDSVYKTQSLSRPNIVNRTDLDDDERHS